MILLLAIFYDCVTGEKRRKFVLDKLKPLMVAKYYQPLPLKVFIILQY